MTRWIDLKQQEWADLCSIDALLAGILVAAAAGFCLFANLFAKQTLLQTLLQTIFPTTTTLLIKNR